MNTKNPLVPSAWEFSAFGHKVRLTRRSFLRTTATATLGGGLIATLPIERSALAGSSNTLKLAVVGCGGRGTGAARQALSTSGPVKLVAMADVQADKLQTGLESLKASAVADRVDVPVANQFTDFDGYKKAIALADVVILATTPGFRPMHFEEAVRQGKHVFMEKPVATDAPGIRRVLAAAEEAKKKNLKVAVGLQRRHKTGYIETIKRIQDGEIGAINLLRCYWNGSSRAGVERLPEETEAHYQIRNWYYFTWASGDHIVEQHVHNIDVCNWIKGGEHPVRAQGMGGRQVRNDPKLHGQIFDHHFVEFEYADGTRMYSQSRQIQGCWASVSEHASGTKGTADLSDGRNLFVIKNPSVWRYPSRGKQEDAFQEEHNDLFDAIRGDKPYNEAIYAAHSTMTGIMGRMATYSGKQIEWEEALNSGLALVPETYGWDSTPPVVPLEDGSYPVAMPGRTVVL